LPRPKAHGGAELPDWIAELAARCDATSQRSVAVQIGVSSPFISKLINRTYEAGYDEAEVTVRAAIMNENVECPIVIMPMPLASCLRNRRREAPPINLMHRQFASACPTCPLNPDRKAKGDVT
jgi:hypothetical protein